MKSLAARARQFFEFVVRRARALTQDDVVVALAAVICLSFVFGLRDVGLRELSASTIPTAPLPSDVGPRDATLIATVVDEQEHAVVGASVRVFAIRDKTAYFTGEKPTNGDGIATLAELPRGEVWVLAYGKEKSRASTHAVLEAGPRAVRLVLHPAKALDVIVTDEQDKPVKGARVEVRGSDPLPYVAITDGGGAARLDRLGPPPYVVKASAPTYEDALRTGVVPTREPLRLKLERLGTLEISVVDAEGKAAPHASVFAAGAALWPARKTEANDAGKTRIAGLKAGAYDLKASLGELVSKTEIGVMLKRGEVKAVELRLFQGKRVSVKVTDGEGDRAPPIKDASVILVEDGVSSFPLLGKTNLEGFVVLGPVPIEVSSVSARALGFVPTTAVKVGEQETEVQVPLHKGGVIIGDVVDDRDYPIAGVTIEVVGTDPSGMPIDETGAPADFRDDSFAAALPGPALLIPIGELGVMPGPIPDLPHGALPFAITNASNGPSKEQWVTRRDGFFRAEPVPPGRVQVIARHAEHVETASETVTVTSGGETKVHIVMREGGVIEGRVLEDDRSPVAGARIEMAATKGSIERFAFAADDGTFTFIGAPDEVLLSVSRPETPTDVAARVTVDVPDRGRAKVEITLPKLREGMKVQVKDDRGYPVDRVEMRALALDPKVPLRKTVFTNQDGDAEIPDCVGLPLRLTLIRPGKAPKIEQLDSAPTELTIVMNEGVHVHGEITGRGGRERLEDAEVTIFTPYGAKHVKTDRDGRYDLDDLAPGRVRVSAYKKDYGESHDVVTVEGDRTHPADLGTIDLAEAGEVEGQVVDDHDDPVAGARVAKDAVPTYLPLGPLPRGIVVTGKDGTFTLGGLPEGAVSIEAYSVEQGRATADNVEVRAGRTTRRVKIALPGGTPTKEARGAGSVAVTLGEHDSGGKTFVDIASVAANSEADSAGLEPGDTLLTVNGKEIHSMDAARKRLTGPLAEDIVVTVEREGGSPTGEPGAWIVRLRRERVRR
jgi:hypothetical protein